jgi:NhaP-type Na+/H+ or K+/H+ antiporter
MLAGLLYVHLASEDANNIDYAYVFVIYLFLMGSRALTLTILFPLLNLITEKPLSSQDATFMAWSGLRGALGIALALVVVADHHHMGIDETMAHQVFLIVGGATTLTLCLNATTSRFILLKLGLVGQEDKDKLMTVCTVVLYICYDII